MCREVLFIPSRTSLTNIYSYLQAASSCPREEYLSWADGLLLVFSLTDMHSFRHARAYAKQLTHLHRTNGIATLCYLNSYSKNYSKFPGLATTCRPVGSTPALRARSWISGIRLTLTLNLAEMLYARDTAYNLLIFSSYP